MDTERKNIVLHRNMAVVGGFFGGYTMLVRCDFLANAQTTNLIHMVFELLGHNFPEFSLRILGWLIYVLGNMTYVFVHRKTRWNVQLLALALDALTLLCLGFFPKDMNTLLAVYPIFFAIPFHWNAFSGSKEYASSTIFSSNNTRQFSLGLGEYLCGGDRKQLKKSLYFLGTLICFYTGIMLAYFAVRGFSVQASWAGIVLLIPAVLIILFVKPTSVSK